MTKKESNSALSFYEVDDQLGRLRIAIDDGSDEPPYMQSIISYKRDTLMFHIVTATALASDPERDELGLWWRSKAALRRAMSAARKAAK